MNALGIETEAATKANAKILHGWTQLLENCHGGDTSVIGADEELVPEK